ncbi:hypothetical protein Ae201684_005975 [Aphanomyces euteiches]|uniref:HTH La-type RNA-binding domain-containing protein n=1 Tax=Aphanomyces euteiches TaxID=100861 RepID=A0A6G0XD96_9STRA|nr:hypothetical protein Ae201684_005975 [Aphanomyces euteiches]KAH9155177.1 hypothetical protein AeRB84_002831 [Aphanomyces euteiches]
MTGANLESTLNTLCFLEPKATRIKMATIASASTGVKYRLVEAEEVDGQAQHLANSENGSFKKKSFNNNDAKVGARRNGSGGRWKNQNGGGRGRGRGQDSAQGTYYNGVFIPNNDVQVTAEYAKQQIEFFLSPDNLVRDTFLRQHMDVDGYVPVAFVGSFQSVYSIHQDYPSLLAAMKTSTFLEFDEKNEKIRPHDWQKWLWPTADGQYGVPRYIKVDEAAAEQ